MKRVFLMVLDSVGIGSLPDAAEFGDAGSNTIRSISTSSLFRIDTLKKLGFGHIESLDYLGTTLTPQAAYGRMMEKSRGKDTTTGHWELAGIISEQPFPTYPQGFPKEVIEAFCRLTNRGVLCNRPYSGTQVIADYGEQHMQTGDLIVYTSADSVFQIAAHEQVVSREELYSICRIARKLLVGRHGVGRVIARPFVGEPGNFTRTDGRRDFSLEPTAPTILDALEAAGREVLAVGKISDIFAGRGITQHFATHSNAQGMETALALQKENFCGLCFINLVDFDMLYGHRNDIEGYAHALSEFDAWLPEFLKQMQPEDVLVITADHGCDPGYPTTDHTREYVPLLVYGAQIAPMALGTRQSFADVAATIAEWLDIAYICPGVSFAGAVKKGKVHG